MTGDIGEKSPLSNGKIVSVNTDPMVYHRTAGKRGEPDFIMSRSELMDFAACPHRWLAGVQSVDTDATKWGSLMDCRWLTPGAFESRFALKPTMYPDTKTGEPKPWSGNSTWCKDWLSKQSGKEVLSIEQLAESDAALRVLALDERITALRACSQVQVFVMCEYQDKPTGIVVPIKALLDLVPDKDNADYGRCLVDFKTARSAGHRTWCRDVKERGYMVQAALYMDAYLSACPDEDRIDFRHVVQENEAPWEVGRRILSYEFTELGRQAYLAALRRYCECLSTGKWPGYEEMTGDHINGWTIVNPEPWMI
jgi:exodeoxyribonuclease VIII